MNLKPPLVDKISNVIESWVQWFDGVGLLLSNPNRDSGTFEPNITGLTVSGGIDVTANYVRKGKMLFFDVVIDPQPMSTTESVLGDAFFELPGLIVQQSRDETITAEGYGTVLGMNVETPSPLGQGYVNLGTNRVFLPSWTSTSAKLAITGSVRIGGL